MADTTSSQTGTLGPLMARGTIVLSFAVALEIVVMISPFAAFFYAVFNPFLLTLAGTPVTRWLTAFFLPHMIVPPNLVLATIRILGSVFFVVGLLGFLVCALQVYAGKLLKLGIASRGLYAVIRHPQYVSLAISGIGLAILWPRFLTLVLLAVMLFLYYVLAKDEERRMLGRYGEDYRAYVRRTGMFLPRWTPADLPANDHELYGVGLVKAAGVLATLLVVVVGGGFVLRAYTIRQLPLLTIRGADAIAITADDLAAARDVIPTILDDGDVAAKLRVSERSGHRLLAYVIPIDYTMQGMIADTGPEWRLFEQHKTFPMISEYVVHPFSHLTEGHGHAMPGHGAMPAHDSPAMKRRVIFIEVSSDTVPLADARDDFDLRVVRRPRLFVDVHLHTGEVLQVRDIPSGTGWGSVPTPTF